MVYFTSIGELPVGVAFGDVMIVVGGVFLFVLLDDFYDWLVGAMMVVVVNCILDIKVLDCLDGVFSKCANGKETGIFVDV